MGLREACRQGREWLDAGIAPGTIAVNISSAQLKAPLVFEEIVLSAVGEAALPGRMLELEISEAALINLSPDHVEVIQRLRRAGIRISLDGFGSGYSSLHYLRQFSVDRIKIAQPFIAEIAASPEAASIVKLILGLSHNFGSDVIAEGVETREQLMRLREMNCADVQGYYFSPPVSVEAMSQLLASGIPDSCGNDSCEARSLRYVEAAGSLQPLGTEPPVNSRDQIMEAATARPAGGTRRRA